MTHWVFGGAADTWLVVVFLNMTCATAGHVLVGIIIWQFNLKKLKQRKRILFPYGRHEQKAWSSWADSKRAGVEMSSNASHWLNT